MIIRTASLDDIVQLSEFWYDNIALQQQSNPRIRLLPNAQKIWVHYAGNLVLSHDVIFLCCEVEDVLVGCLIARIVDNMPGLDPPQYGLVEMLILDLHMSTGEKGVGKALLSELLGRLREYNITQLQVQVGLGNVVEQVFWRGVGAKNNDQIFWMAL